MAMLLRSVLLLALVSAAIAWGVEGHAIIAQVASQFLSDSATQMVKQFLGSNTMSSVSSDADDYRDTEAGVWSAPLHYINANKGQTNLDLSVDCPDSICVIDAIGNYSKRFHNDAQNPFMCNLDYNEVEPCALVFLIHFVGDVHQPLHCGYGIDRGGNDIRVNWFGQDTNLHAVWDVSIIQKYNSDYTSFAAELVADLKQYNPYGNTTDPLAMGDESFYWVRNLVYDFTGQDLSDAYYNMALPLVKERLAAAGYRLALTIENYMEHLQKR